MSEDINIDLINAVNNGATENVEMYLNNGADPNTITETNNGIYPIVTKASTRGYHKIVELLLEHGADINKLDDSNSNSLHYLCTQVARLYMMELLLDNDIDPNVQDIYEQTPLMIAAMHGKYEKVDMLLKHPKTKDIIECNLQDKNGKTALYYACERGYKDIANLLIPCSNIELSENKYGITPLYIASYRGFTNIVESLIENGGAEINYRNKSGDTPLNVAVRHNNTDTSELLMVYADLNFQDKNEQTALMVAAYQGNLQIVKSLLSYSATDVNLQSDNGNTALIWAAHIHNQKNQKEIIKLLLERGADPNITNYNSQTYYDKINRNKKSNSIQRSYKDYKLRKKNKAASKLQSIARGNLTRKKKYIPKFRRYKQWKDRGAFDSIILQDEDIFNYLRENDNNFVIQIPGGQYEAWNLDDLYTMFTIPGVNIENDFNYFYGCLEANGSLNRNNISMRTLYIKLGASNFVVQMPDWMYDFDEKIPEPKIFILKPYKIVNGLVSNAILNHGASYVSGDHCNQLEPIQTYWLEPATEEDLIKSRQRMNFFHNFELPIEIQNRISESHRSIKHNPNVLNRTRLQNIEDIENERIAEYADFFDDHNIDDLNYDNMSISLGGKKRNKTYRKIYH
jgi:ankyrin repeat protein